MGENVFEDVDWIQGILEFSSTGLWQIIMDNNTSVNVMYASQSMLNLLGLRERISPEACYQHWWNNIEEEYRDYVFHAVEQMILTGEQKEVQYVWNHPELGKIFVRCSGKVEKKENGICEIRGYHQNITEVEVLKAEQEMTVEEKKIVQKINNLKNTTKRLDEQSQAWRGLLRKVLENTSTFEAYYYPKERKKVHPEEICNKYHWNKQYEGMPYSFSQIYVEPEYQQVYEAMYESIHNGADSASCEVAFRGQKQWFHAILSVIEHDEKGYPTLVVSTVEDITERKLSQLEKKQLQIISNFTINHDYECLAIIDVEANQYFVHYSENWEKKHFSEVDTITDDSQKRIKNIIHESDISKFTIHHIIENLNKEKESEYIIFYRSTNNIHKEARCCWFEKNKKLLITVQNVERRWRQEQESKQKIMEALEIAEAANHAKSDFLSRMSHDIRTPLNAIMGMTNIAKKYSNDMDKVKYCLDSISNSSNYLTLLINDVLDMAKIENGKLKLNEEKFDLDEIVTKMLPIVTPLIDSKKHQMIVNYEKLKHKWVKGDMVRLQQILLNILSNAVKYTNPEGKIEFNMKELSSNKKGYGFYQFDIIDNGIGMDKEFLLRLFNPFERKDNERVGHIEGTGLGMSIAKNIANMMEGDITVESEENKGSHFTLTVYLKLLEEQQEGSSFKEQEKQIPNFTGKNILLVEDNVINLEIAEEILSTTGAKIETAENGKEAVEKVEQSIENYYSMIFMDVRMPIMNGYEAVEIIRGLERQDVKIVPIIAMTADAFAEDVKKAKDCGMNEHIAKPIDIDKLYEIMKQYNELSVETEVERRK